MSEENMIRSMVLGMVAVFIILLQYFSIGPGYYTMLVQLNETAWENSLPGSNARANLPILYDTFYWGYPALTAFGLIFSVAWIVEWARRIYYAAGERFR